MATVEQVMESSLALVLADTDDIPTEPEEISKLPLVLGAGAILGAVLLTKKGKQKNRT